MKKRPVKKIEKCSEMRQKLIEMVTENTTYAEYPQLETHITGCQECAAFLKFVTQIEMKIAGEGGQLPNPRQSILRNTIKYMAIRRPSIRIKSNILEKFTAVFQYRIPVYQAVGGFIVLLFISGFLWNNNSVSLKKGFYGDREGIVSQDIYVSDTLTIRKSEKGQSAREDSILVNFLQYSL